MISIISARVSTAESTITVPWLEFKSLYRQQLERDLQHKLTSQRLPPLYAIDEANYEFSINTDGIIHGRIAVHGQVLQGRPDPIPLFARDLTITHLDTVQGGALLSSDDHYQFFVKSDSSADDGKPAETLATFKVSFKVAVPVQEDQRSRFIELAIPNALKNSLKINLSEPYRLLDSAGLTPHTDGYHYFSSRQRLQVRFTDSTLDITPVIDTFTRIELTGSGYLATGYFVPIQPLSADLLISLGSGSMRQTSLSKPSWIKRETGGQLRLSLPPGWQQAFQISYAVDTDVTEFPLPRISNNQGREGEFQLQNPVAARITPQAEALQRSLSATRLSPAMQSFAAIQGQYFKVPPDSALSLELLRFDTVSAPAVVLDAIHLYTSYSENGNALSILRFELPAATGPTLQLQPVAEAEIWSLTVNGARQPLYSHQQSQWIIPLPQTAAVVELAYLQKGDKLRLQGRLPLSIPATGLAASRLNIAIALTERVELIALEGDLEPTKPHQWPTVEGFVGKPYFFSQPFYRGEALEAAIYYKEPLDRQQAGKSS